MPTGCDFTCDNEKCEHHKKGFILRSSWPLGNIDRVIMAKNVRINKEFQKELNREFIGIEMNKEYMEIAERRIGSVH